TVPSPDRCCRNINGTSAHVKEKDYDCFHDVHAFFYFGAQHAPSLRPAAAASTPRVLVEEAESPVDPTGGAWISPCSRDARQLGAAVPLGRRSLPRIRRRGRGGQGGRGQQVDTGRQE